MTNIFISSIFTKLNNFMDVRFLFCPENKAFLNEMYELNFVTFYR